MDRLLLALICVLVAAGCGSDEPKGDPLAALDAAAKKTQTSESNRQEFSMVSDIDDLKSDQLPLPPGKEWLKTTDAPSSTLSPSEFVDFLRASDEVNNEGTEEIRGEQTTHYRGSVNLRELAEASRSELLRRLNQAPNVNDLETTIDIWVRDDGLPARLVLEVKPPQDEASGSVKVTTDILEYDVEVDAEPPPPSKVVEG